MLLAISTAVSFSTVSISKVTGFGTVCSSTLLINEFTVELTVIADGIDEEVDTA